MSHFTVMVIGDEPEKQLAAFQENNMGDCPSELLKLNYNGVYYNSIDEAKAAYLDFDEDESYWENPNAKWDWYVLGGRWSGMIKLKKGKSGEFGNGSLVMGNRPGIDQAKRGDIENLNELKTFAIIKNGKWYERGEMGWWGVVHNESDEVEWHKQIEALLSGLQDDELISIYDCHI